MYSDPPLVRRSEDAKPQLAPPPTCRVGFVCSFLFLPCALPWSKSFITTGLCASGCYAALYTCGDRKSDLGCEMRIRRSQD
jgi:hypothetical protein